MLGAFNVEKIGNEGVLAQSKVGAYSPITASLQQKSIENAGGMIPPLKAVVDVYQCLNIILSYNI
jgi:hypothetical protein